jgi:hypothetical protein
LEDAVIGPCEDKFNLKEIVMTAKLESTVVVLALMLAVCMLFSNAVLAQGTNCPPEPSQDTPIYDGEVYFGSNCTLSSPGDVDSFVFNASSGQTYHLALGINGAAPVNICMKLYDPNEMNIFSGCTSINYPNYQNSVVKDQLLVTTGTYTIVVTESTTGTIEYGLELERLYPFPPNAQQINLSTQIPGNINPITDTNEFTFASATTGTQEVSATLPGNASSNICLRVYNPDGTLVQNNDVCTSINYPNYLYTVQVDFTPDENGTSMVFVYVAGNDGTAAYTFEVSCLLGMCGTTSIPDVAGYIILQGVPLAGAGVALTQPGAPGPQLTVTDSNGYYQFLHAIAGADFNVQIKGPVVPRGFGKPVSADTLEERQDRSEQ